MNACRKPIAPPSSRTTRSAERELAERRAVDGRLDRGGHDHDEHDDEAGDRRIGWNAASIDAEPRRRGQSEQHEDERQRDDARR